jgi:hypothetical protein
VSQSFVPFKENPFGYKCATCRTRRLVHVEIDAWVEGTQWPQMVGGEHCLSLMVIVSLEAKLETH